MWKIIGFSILATVVVVTALSIDAHQPPPPDRPAVGDSTPAHRVYAIGRVEGWTEQIDLRPQLSGRIDELLITEGQAVEAGQVLMRLDSRHYAHQVQLASAELESTRAELQRRRNGPTRHELHEAAALYEAKVAELQHTQLTWERLSHLHQAKAIPVQKADDQRSALARVQSEAAAAKARLDNLKTQPRADDVRIAETRVSAAQARLDSMMTELDRTQLRSPIKGQILRVDAKVGEMAGPTSQEPAIAMADMSRFTVKAFVEELDAPRVRVGTPAHVTADGLPGQQYEGRVVRLSPMMGPKQIRSDRPTERHDTKTREVWIELSESAEGLIFGLRVDVYFELEESPSESTGPRPHEATGDTKSDARRTPEFGYISQRSSAFAAAD